MKKISNGIKQLRQKIFDFYKTKSTKEIIILTALFLSGFWWPLGACIIYIILAFYKYGKYRIYGLFAVIGGAANIFYYLLTVFFRLLSRL